MMTSGESQDSRGSVTPWSLTREGAWRVFVEIFTSRCNISAWVKPSEILSRHTKTKRLSVDCVSAVLLVLIIDVCCEFCCASSFNFQISLFFFFFSYTCAAVGWPPRSLKESHNIWIATYHTQARKKLNLHSLRWMLCWSGALCIFGVITLLFCSACPLLRACVVGGGNSGCPCNCMHEQRFRNESRVIILFQGLSGPPVKTWDHTQIYVEKDELFIPGPRFYSTLGKWSNLRSQEDQFVFVSLIFFSQSLHSRESSWSRHTQSRAPSPQKSAHSLYSPNTLLKAVFCGCTPRTKVLQLSLSTSQTELGGYFWESFFFTLLLSSPSSSPTFDSPRAVFVS